MSIENNFFEWSDAWVFVALFTYDNRFQPISLSRIISSGDVINHAIFTGEELRQGFKKLTDSGLIEVQEGSIRLSKEAILVKDKIENGKGGMFTMVDNTLKKLNSPRLKISNLKPKSSVNLAFLNDEAIHEGYVKYKIEINNN